MPNTQDTVQILIDIRTKLDELKESQEAFRRARDEARSFGAMLQTGLGIDLARRGISLLTASLRQSAGEAIRMAGAVKDMSEALDLSTRDYQVLGLEFQAAGADLGRLTEAVSTQTRSLAEARDASSGAAKAYAALGLSAQLVESLPVAERLIVVARALIDAQDRTAGFAAAAQILGSRGLPQLMNALQRLAREGLPAVSEAWEKAGQVMSDETITRLDRASKAWEGLWRGIVVHSGEALVAIQRFVGEEKNVALVAAQQRVWELEAVVAAAQRAGRQASTRDREMLAAARAQYAHYAVLSGDESNIRAARDGARKIVPADTGLMSAMDHAAVARVESAYQRLETAATKAREQTTAHNDALKKQAEEQRTIAASAALRTTEIERQKQLLSDVVARVDNPDGLSAQARAVIEANLTPLQRYNVELERLAALTRALPEEFLERARAAAGDTLRAAQEAEVEKRLAPLRAEIVAKSAEVDALEAEAARLSSRTGIDAATQQRSLAAVYERIRAILGDIIKLERQQLASVPENAPVKRAEMQAKIDRLEMQRATIGSGEPPAGLAGVRQRAHDRISGRTALAPSEGFEAGALNFVAQVGSTGEQVANTLQQTLGAAVNSIGDGIYGWITGTRSFGDAMRDLAGGVLRAFLQALVQIAAQQLILAALGDTLAVKEAARDKAQVGTKATKGFFESISQLGPIAGPLAFAAAIAAVAGLLGGFRERGGPVSPGRAYVVGEKRPELFVPSVPGTILPSLDALEMPAPTISGPVAAPAPVAASPAFAAAAGHRSAARPQMVVMLAENLTDVRRIKMQPGWEDAIVETVQRRRGEILG